MRKTLSLYFDLIKLQLRIQTQYRAGLAFEFLGTLIFTLGGFATVALLLER